MLFADSSLVCRIEDAERRLTTDVATAIQKQNPERGVYIAELGGGAAVHVGIASPFNKLIGIGLRGPLSAVEESTLESIERAFAERQTPVQAEVSTLADSSLVRLLTSRGYLLLGFENVLGLRLDETLSSRLAQLSPPDGVKTAPCQPDEERRWLDTVIDGFALPDSVPGGESHESFPREAIEQAMTDMAHARGFTRYVSRIDGEIAGGASLRIFEGVAQLCGSATRPNHRRRGVQTALLARRLLDAFAAGCDVAVITTQPGSKSQQNAQRRGFTLLYSRAVLVREPR